MTYQQNASAGADPNVTKLYGERTVDTSCNYFVSHVTKSADILDVGCGPGVITSDLAKIATEGRTIGLDNSPDIIEQAQAALTGPAVPNLSFVVGDANKLDFPDNSFDIVHAHQVMVHLPNPVAGLKELYRVCKPGGFIAVRDSSPSVVLSLKPDVAGVRAYWDRANAVMEKMGSHSKAGIDLERWASEAGYGKDGGEVVYTKSPMWNPSHLHRTTGVPADQAIQYGMATKEEMAEWNKSWTEWEAAEEHEFVFECGEILCWKGQ